MNNRKQYKHTFIISFYGVNILGCAVSLLLTMLFSLILGEVGAVIGYICGSFTWAIGALFLIYRISKSYAYRAQEKELDMPVVLKTIHSAFLFCLITTVIILFLFTLFYLTVVSGFLCGPIVLILSSLEIDKWVGMVFSLILTELFLFIYVIIAKKGILAGTIERKEAFAYYRQKEHESYGKDNQGKITHRNYLD